MEKQNTLDANSKKNPQVKKRLKRMRRSGKMFVIADIKYAERFGMTYGSGFMTPRHSSNAD
jgi:hypothetical protein